MESVNEGKIANFNRFVKKSFLARCLGLADLLWIVEIYLCNYETFYRQKGYDYLFFLFLLFH